MTICHKLLCAFLYAWNNSNKWTISKTTLLILRRNDITEKCLNKPVIFNMMVPEWEPGWSGQGQCKSWQVGAAGGTGEWLEERGTF